MNNVVWEISAADSFTDFAEKWDALNQQCGALPFLESDFIVPALHHFGSGRERLAVAHQGRKIVAATLLAPAGLGRWMSFQPAQLPLGPWLSLPAHSLASLLPPLLRALPGCVLNAGLTQFDPLLQARPPDAARLRTLDYIVSAWVDIDQPFADYWAMRGKNLRHNLRKQRNQLEAAHITLDFAELRASVDVPSAIAAYGVLETQGWKGEIGTAVSAENKQGLFYRDMLTNFCRKQRGRIWQLRFNDEVVASDLCIESAHTLVILKTAFAAEIQHFSPAFLMHQMAFERLFASHLRRIEFYGRQMPWHTRWTDQARTLYHLNVYRWGFIPALWQRFRPPVTPAQS